MLKKDWKDFVKKQKEQDLEAIIKDEKLKHDESSKIYRKLISEMVE